MAERRTYLQFAFAGVPTAAPMEVAERTMEGIKIPAGAYGYCFYDQVVLTAEVDGQEIELWTTINPSPNYYIGYLYSAKEVAELVPNSEHLLLEMDRNEWSALILTGLGTWLPWEEGDEIVAPEEVGLGAGVT
jgi:hypothetical protein